MTNQIENRNLKPQAKAGETNQPNNGAGAHREPSVHQKLIVALTQAIKGAKEAPTEFLVLAMCLLLRAASRKFGGATLMTGGKGMLPGVFYIVAGGLRVNITTKLVKIGDVFTRTLKDEEEVESRTWNTQGNLPTGAVLIANLKKNATSGDAEEIEGNALAFVNAVERFAHPDFRESTLKLVYEIFGGQAFVENCRAHLTFKSKLKGDDRNRAIEADHQREMSRRQARRFGNQGEQQEEGRRRRRPKSQDEGKFNGQNGKRNGGRSFTRRNDNAPRVQENSAKRVVKSKGEETSLFWSDGSLQKLNDAAPPAIRLTAEQMSKPYKPAETIASPVSSKVIETLSIFA